MTTMLRFLVAAAFLCGARTQLPAQGHVPTRSIREADSSVVGHRALLAGRVLLGSGVLDSSRLRIFVGDTAGAVLIESAPQVAHLPFAVGDSVWVTGVVRKEDGWGYLAQAFITRINTARSNPVPVPLGALTPSQLAALTSRLAVAEGTVVALGAGAAGKLLTIHDTVTDGNFLTVVQEPAGTVAMGFDRFSVGDRVRVTGVLTRRTSPHTGITRYAMLPRSAADVVPIGMTARARTTVLHAGAIVVMAMALVAVTVALRRRERRHHASAVFAGAELARGYQMVLEQAPIGIVVLDDSRIVYANTAFVKLVGASSADSLHSARFSDFVSAHTAEHAAATGATLGTNPGASEPMRLKGLDGRLVEVEIAESRIDYGGRACVQLAVNNVTERVRAQQALAEGEVRVRQMQKLEAVGQLAGGVAHDFNNILTVIKGNAALLMQGCQSCFAVPEEAHEIDRAADRGAALTGQLLAFSRKQVIKPTTLELDVVVKNLERMLRRLVPENVEQRFSLNAPRSFVLADAGQLEQVIVNLVVNAKDAMPTGGVLAIRTTNVVVHAAPKDAAHELDALEPGNYVCVAISDTGTGMDDDTRRRAFEPFFTTKEPGKGTGLGLATVYGIARQNNGHVFIGSLQGMGTTVRLYLPKVGAAAREAPPAEPAPVAAAGPLETILLVEDEGTIRKLAARVLRGNGYRVLEAGNGMDAISLMQKESGALDLLITDVIMPGLSGAELASHLCRERPRLRVLYVSGYTDDHLASHGVLRSDVQLLQKPFAPSDLLRCARQMLSDRPVICA